LFSDQPSDLCSEVNCLFYLTGWGPGHRPGSFSREPGMAEGLQRGQDRLHPEELRDADRRKLLNFVT